VLFVSHNLLAIQALCQHALWLDHGSEWLRRAVLPR
jgi:ABC-type polysaccharide/polyol phosphate transport system ATPase subunit